MTVSEIRPFSAFNLDQSFCLVPQNILFFLWTHKENVFYSKSYILAFLPLSENEVLLNSNLILFCKNVQELILSDQTRVFPKHLYIDDPIVAFKMNTASQVSQGWHLWHSCTTPPPAGPCWFLSSCQGGTPGTALARAGALPRDTPPWAQHHCLSAWDLFPQLCFLVITQTFHLQLRKECTPIHN